MDNRVYFRLFLNESIIIYNSVNLLMYPFINSVMKLIAFCHITNFLKLCIATSLNSISLCV